ncbi:MAG: hypothetical protein K0S28_444 [Paucimonas sp.]|jgi:hypothetical protein|nr:hypothetical protein [Paucimonas sp.]
MHTVELYVYYRAACAYSDELASKIKNMQNGLARNTGASCALKRRPEAKDGHYTWMEIYAGVTEDFLPLLQCAIAEAGIEGLIDGSRHTEVFMDANACV